MSNRSTPDLEPIPVLSLGPWQYDGLARALAPRFVLMPMWQHEHPDEYLAAVGRSVRAILTHTGSLPTDASLLDRLPNVEVIINLGAGFESIDLAEARRRGIAVANGAGANAPDVAELAIALMLAAGRGLLEGDRHVREQRWAIERAPTTRRVSGKKLGLLGMGHIGQSIARMAGAFDMQVSYCTRRPIANLPYAHVQDLVALAHVVDFLVVACPGGPATRHLVDESVLNALGPGGVLVNIARGSVVDEAALAAALTDRRLGGAALDVFEHEPHVPASLRASDKVVLQAHRGGSTYEAFEGVVELAALNLKAFFTGKPLLTPAEG